MDLPRATVAQEGIRPLSRAEYDRLVELGLFADERVELLHGVIVPMSPQGPRHSYTVTQLTMIFAPALVGRAEVRVQAPFATSEDGEPEPDVSIVPVGDWQDDHPDVAHLLIEVSVSSQRRDRTIKLAMYAAAGVPEYWVVDLPARTLSVFREPVGDQYRSLQTFDERQSVAPLAFPEVVVPIGAILPRAAQP